MTREREGFLKRRRMRTLTLRKEDHHTMTEDGTKIATTSVETTTITLLATLRLSIQTLRETTELGLPRFLIAAFQAVDVDLDRCHLEIDSLVDQPTCRKGLTDFLQEDHQKDRTSPTDLATTLATDRSAWTR